MLVAYYLRLERFPCLRAIFVGNADYLVNQDAAMRLDDEKLTDHLLPLLEQTLFDEAVSARMSANAASLKRPDAAARIADLLAGYALNLPESRG